MVAPADWADAARGSGPARRVRPAYGGRCFADIPATLVRMLSGTGPDGLSADVLGELDGRHDRVALILLDAFGWSAFERHSGHPFLRRFAQDGVVAQITSQFPSTTAAHVTCLHTGLPVGAGGIYEWFQYEPALDAIVAPLLFSFAGDASRETLRATAADPDDLYPETTLYPRLAAAGVRSTVLQHEAFTPSTYGSVVLAGADVRPFATLRGALAEMAAALRAPGRAYVVLYVGTIDAAGHDHGPASAACTAEATAVLDALEEALADLAGCHALLLLTADHGMTAIDPGTTMYVNLLWPGIAEHLRRGRGARPLAPAGSARDLFLHVRPGRLEEVAARLTELTVGRAEVYATADLVEDGIFGQVGERLRARLADLVVLPNAGESIWWYERGRFEQRFRGHHGGLTAEEMLVPFAALPLG